MQLQGEVNYLCAQAPRYEGVNRGQGHRTPLILHVSRF